MGGTACVSLPPKPCKHVKVVAREAAKTTKLLTSESRAEQFLRDFSSPADGRLATPKNPSSFCSQALESLNKKDMTEIKSYGRPPPLVEKVMSAVMTLQGKEATWAEAKRQLGEARRQRTTNHRDRI